MDGSVARKRNTQCRTKVKTGCTTCRKVKCDETKPLCRKCVDTGRACDGYASPFRLVSSQSISISNVRHGSAKAGAGSPPTHAMPAIEIPPQDVELLSRYFSTKTLLDVKLGCSEEARQILLASLTDASVRHAVSSLRALREHLELSGDAAASIAVAQQSPSSRHDYDYGLQQYCMALGGLASSLSSPSSGRIRSALFCCQIFISIEQVQGNFVTLVQHIIQGLGIMQEHRARPSLLATNELVPAHRDQLPLLDVFVIKLFAAPSKFAEPPEIADVYKAAGAGSQTVRLLAPDLRAGLTRIATSTLELLANVSRVASAKGALRLVSEKTPLLDSLNLWLVNLETIHANTRPPLPELITVTFLRLFHQILKVILLGVLDCSQSLGAEIQAEHARLRAIASDIEKRIESYRWSRNTVQG